MSGQAPATRLRRDLIVVQAEAGGPVEIADTLLERVLPVPEALGPLPEPGAEASDPALVAWLQANLLAEGPMADELRQSCWAARARRTVHLPTLEQAPGPWQLAPNLPPWVAPQWREPERWRRLAEERAAGCVLLRLPGLLTTEAARELRETVEAAATTRCENPYAAGFWDQDTQIAPEFRAELHGAGLHGGGLHALLSAALGVALPGRAQWNAWRLLPGDAMALHADGTRYAATVSVGLSEGWRAIDGGAIAFGTPDASGLVVRERWLPQLGDVLAFVVGATGWHAVEEVRSGVRCTLTGQYLL
ncbi:MAG: 2OG-Fe(II) oxygenase [Deltaproteobacteria bacterium]|nr:2OG-Fe(II) oxygenase [Deltaproteobacteria bacterium]